MRLVGYVPASLSGLDTGSGAQEQQPAAVYFDTTETARAERAERDLPAAWKRLRKPRNTR